MQSQRYKQKSKQETVDTRWKTKSQHGLVRSDYLPQPPGSRSKTATKVGDLRACSVTNTATNTWPDPAIRWASPCPSTADASGFACYCFQRRIVPGRVFGAHWVRLAEVCGEWRALYPPRVAMPPEKITETEVLRERQQFAAEKPACMHGFVNRSNGDGRMMHCL